MNNYDTAIVFIGERILLFEVWGVADIIFSFTLILISKKKEVLCDKISLNLQFLYT